MANRWMRPLEQSEALARAESECEQFEQLFRGHFQTLVQSLGFVALNRQAAEDAVQDAFLRLYVHWDGVRDPEDSIGWLYRTGYNRVMDQRRAAGRVRRLLGSLVERFDSEGRLGSWEGLPEIMGALRRLPLKRRTAASPFYLAELPIAEVAAVMGITEGSVNQHLNRARATLRKSLEVRSVPQRDSLRRSERLAFYKAIKIIRL